MHYLPLWLEEYTLKMPAKPTSLLTIILRDIKLIIIRNLDSCNHQMVLFIRGVCSQH